MSQETGFIQEADPRDSRIIEMLHYCNLASRLVVRHSLGIARQHLMLGVAAMYGSPAIGEMPTKEDLADLNQIFIGQIALSFTPKKYQPGSPSTVMPNAEEWHNTLQQFVSAAEIDSGLPVGSYEDVLLLIIDHKLPAISPLSADSCAIQTEMPNAANN